MLVGRAEVLARADEAFAVGESPSRSVGVVFVGPAGIGKTAIADELASRVAASDPVELWRLYASELSGRIPLGVLGTSLPPEFLDSPLSPTLALKQMLADLDGELVVIVDDADLVDVPSADALAAAGTAGMLRLILTQRSGTTLPAPFRRLVDTGVVARIDCGPLGDAATIELASRSVGGPLAPSTERLVVDLTLGNPLFVRELVLAARETGCLVEQDVGWELVDIPTDAHRLTDLLANRLHGLSEHQREVLEWIAASEPIGPRELASVADEVLLDDLRDLDMITFELDGRRLRVRIAHPLIAETLRSSSSPLAMRRRRSSLSASLRRPGARRREDRLRLATWSLDGGDPVPTEYLVEASRMAFSAGDAERSAMLAQLAFDQDPSFETGRVLEGPLYELGDPERLEAFYERWLPMATTERERSTAARCVASGRFWRGAADDSVDALVAAADRSTDRAAVVDLLAQATSLRAMEGRVAEAIAIGEPLCDEPPSEAFIHVALGLGHSRRAAGRPESALALLELVSSAYRAVGPEAYLLSNLVLDGTRLAAMVDAGRFDAVRSDVPDVESLAAGSGQPTAVGLARLSLSWCDIRQGRWSRALAEAQEAERWLYTARHPGMVRWAIAFQALASACANDTAAARSSLDRLDALPSHPARLFDVVAVRARAKVASLDGASGRAVELLVAGAEDAIGVGNVASASMCAHDLARLGRSAEAAAVVAALDRCSGGDVAAVIEGPVLTAELAHIRALGAGRVEELGACGARFAEIGQPHLAVEAANAAARLAAQRSDVAAGNRWLRRSAEWADDLEERPAENPYSLIDLTDREVEVARLAATGLASREIGERLYISARTVDSHLRRVYTKLGVHGRADLAAMFTER